MSEYPYSVHDMGRNHLVRFYNVYEILASQLRRHFGSLICDAMYNGKVFGHFCTGSWWRDFVSECREKHGNDVIPVALEISFDDFTPTRKSSVGPVYLCISSMQNKAKHSLVAKSVLFVKPKECCICECLEVVTKQLEELERRPVDVWIGDTRVQVLFRLALIIGDTPASNAMLGMKNQKALVPCRQCLVPAAQKWKALGQEQYLRKENEIEGLRDVLQKVMQVKGKKGEAEKEAKTIGVKLEKKNPFRRLHLDSYISAPPCLLHLEELGLMRAHLIVTLEHSPSKKIVMKMLEKVKPRGYRNPKYCRSFTGGEIRAFARVGPAIMASIKAEDERKCWKLHFESFFLLHSPSLTAQGLERLQSVNTKWRQMAKDIFPRLESSDIDAEFGGGTNWHSGDHWCRLIETFGVPSQFSGQRYEAKHQDVKKMKKVSNNHSHARDLGAKAVRAAEIENSVGRVEDHVGPVHKKRKSVSVWQLSNRQAGDVVITTHERRILRDTLSWVIVDDVEEKAAFWTVYSAVQLPWGKLRKRSPDELLCIVAHLKTRVYRMLVDDFVQTLRDGQLVCFARGRLLEKDPDRHRDDVYYPTSRQLFPVKSIIGHQVAQKHPSRQKSLILTI